ncbi:hypothetical protein [Streptomyces sp. NPDC005408]|uniref:hypothetical protein n=1 Tax=Streptomyces sp. NPDC005408 TaxID=3155341 RepID=UPI0033B34DAF
MTDHEGTPIVVSGITPGDPPFRFVQINGKPVGVAHNMVDVIRLAYQAGLKDVDLDDPALVRWVGGDKYRWTP